MGMKVFHLPHLHFLGHKTQPTQGKLAPPQTKSMVSFMLTAFVR